LADHTYRRFGRDDLLHTTVRAQPHFAMDSGTGGWTGSPLLNSNALSLYGGVRARSDVASGSTSGLQVYPIDDVNTNSIDKVIGIPGEYPQTGSVNLVFCTDEDQGALLAIDPFNPAYQVTDTRWFDEHWAPINILSDWHHQHTFFHYPALDQLPATMTLVHVPEMFYGRRIATGSIVLISDAWQTVAASNVWADTTGTGTIPLSGVQYYGDDGLGRLNIYTTFTDPSTDGDDYEEGIEDGSITDPKRGLGGLVTGSDGRALVAGYVFYDEGLIVFTHPSGSWHLENLSQSFATTPRFGVRFDGDTIMQSYVFMCRMAPGDVNASNNPTFYYVDAAGKRWIRSPGQTYITAVGIYNEERELVAVAKVAQPIRKRDQDNLDIRLKLDI